MKSIFIAIAVMLLVAICFLWAKKGLRRGRCGKPEDDECSLCGKKKNDKKTCEKDKEDTHS